MPYAILLSLLSLLVSFLTGNLLLGFTLVPLFFIIIKFASDELKSIIGEGKSDLFSIGFLLPILATTNQHFLISIAVFLFIMIWILTLKTFLPNWNPSRQRLFTIGILTAILNLLQFYLFITILPILILTLYKSRSSIKQMVSLITGFAWILLGVFFISPLLPHLVSIRFKLQLNTIVSSDPGLKYFLYTISIITLLWALNLYRVRHKWGLENRHLIFNMVLFSLLCIAMLKFDLLPTIVISLPILHMAWNLQIKKSNLSLAFALAIIILVWLNQQYVLNFLNLQY